MIMIVDEAGRGPVLGPMVYAVAVAPISNAADLKKRSFADSKTLTAERRDELYDELDSDDTLCCFVDEIAPEFISGHMLAPEKTSLNTIAFDSTCKLINQCLAANINVQEVYVDTVGDAKTYQVCGYNLMPYVFLPLELVATINLNQHVYNNFRKNCLASLQASDLR